MRPSLLSGLAVLFAVGLCVSAPSEVAAAQAARAAKAPSVEQRLRLLEDKEEIRDLLVSYGRDFDKRDFAAYAGLFAKDGVWMGGTDASRAYTGADAIRQFVSKTFPPSSFPGSFHIMSSPEIHIDGDGTAHAWSRWTYVVIGLHGEPAPFAAGYYEDTLVKESGTWKFKRRQVLTAAANS
jgi:uncharacterized protein (TIGR02246 family)